MRRTSGRPASAISMGMATAVSSSSAPIAGFCTMTLKMGADRSGNTSRRRSWSATAPKAARARASTTVRPGPGEGRLQDAVRPPRGSRQCSCSSPPPRDFSASALSRKAPSTTTCSPAFSPESTSTSPPRSRPRPTSRRSKTPLRGGEEDDPAVLQPLERGGGHGGDGGGAAQGHGGRGGHARSQQPLAVVQLQAHGDGARGRIHLLAHMAHLRGELLAGEGREGDARLAARLDAHGVALERMDDQPQARTGRRRGRAAGTGPPSARAGRCAR